MVVFEKRWIRLKSNIEAKLFQKALLLNDTNNKQPITMEFSFVNFQTQFNFYKENYDKILLGTREISANDNQILYLFRVSKEFQNLDIKIRLAFGISEIKLNPTFVSDKEEDLKRCHLLYYKLADLWFAYEAYIKFYTVVNIRKKDKFKVNWIDEISFIEYANSPIILGALNQANDGFYKAFDTQEKKQELISYLEYCERQAVSEAQIKRIKKIISKVDEVTNPLVNSEFLTIIYAIRNNFVHNGETTIVPDNFGFRNKRILLDILYPYLCLVLLNSINITCDNMKNT